MGGQQTKVPVWVVTPMTCKCVAPFGVERPPQLRVVLQIALTRLARHYGLIGTEARQERPGRGLRHWGSEDYRPTLDAWSGDQ
jgi:hypothetical protein